MTRFDPAFEVWLNALLAQGYDPDFIQHNINVLQKRYEEGVTMRPMPERPFRQKDRYEEL